jgi:hypothetical protein
MINALHYVKLRSEACQSGLQSNVIVHGFSKCGTCADMPSK